MREELLKTLHFRHACKEFDPTKKISKEDFDVILQAARLSPISFGIEPWKFLVVQNEALRQKINDNIWGARKQLPTCSHYVIILARKAHFMRYDAPYVPSYMKNVQKSPDEVVINRLKVYENFQKSDFDLANNDRALFDWSCKQTYIALANMLTISAFLGIDSCPIEGFNMDKMNHILREDFQIDTNHYGISVMAAFGYRINPARPKARLAEQEVIEWFY